jgi:Flp pilus assembly protein CpaB
MAEPPNSDLRYMPSGASASRKSAPNVSSGWVIMILSALIAAVVFLFVTNQADKTFSVLVAARDIQSGQTVDQSMFRETKVTLDSSQVNRLILFADRSRVTGFTASGPIKQGDLVAKAALIAPATGQNERAMSIPVEKTRAANGVLVVGDRVDIVFVGEAPLFVPNLQVLAVADNAGGGLGAANTFVVTVAVDPDEAVQISTAINSNGKFDVIRSTAATPFNGTSLGDVNPAA